MRAELHELLREFALPTILVTHDYEDAAALADRVGVLVEGRLRQLATPSELVDGPADAFVASFTGANLLHGRAHGRRRAHLGSARDGETIYSTDRGRGRGRRRRLSVGGLGRPRPARRLGAELDRRARSSRSSRSGIASASVSGRSLPRSQRRPRASSTSRAAGSPFATFKATGTRLVPLERGAQLAGVRPAHEVDAADPGR